MTRLDYTVIEGVKCFSPDVARSYEDYPDAFELTDSNAESSFWVQSRDRLFRWLVHRHLAAGRRTRLLEVGCGTGEFIGQLAEDDRLEVTGSEVYLKGLIYAKRNLPQVEFVQFDVTQGIIDEDYDIVAAFDVLEHIEDDLAAMANLHRMLSSDGVAIISVPQYMFMWSKLDELVKHKRRYSRSEMVTKLTDSGFEIVRCTSFVFMLFPLMLVSRLLDRLRREPSNSAPESEDAALESRVTFPSFVNRIFDLVMRVDELLIRLGLPLPFGGTLVVVARKR